MDQTDVLFRSLAIALVIVAPFAIFKVRQIRRNNRLFEQARADSDVRNVGSDAPIPALEDVIGDIGFVEAEANRNGGALLVVPHRVTVSDRPAPPELVDTLVRDALRRSNLLITAEADSDEGRLLECAPTSSSGARPRRVTERPADAAADRTDGSAHP